ncbi:MAG: hypothetical protein HC804_08830 [Anaerolineae bacterium]|nr:hypothetical protein [Anaerolineae bacterium]
MEHAAAIMQALCLPELYIELVRHSGWLPEQYQTWLAETLKREMLASNS